MTEDITRIYSSEFQSVKDVRNIVRDVPDSTEIWLAFVDAIEHPPDQVHFTVEQL